MPEAVLLLDAFTNGVTGLVYAVVGLRLHREGLSAAGDRAWRNFSVWWFALSATGFIASLFSTLAYLGVQDVALYATLQHALIVTFALAMSCLVYYVTYLWTGREWTRWPIRALYLVYLLAFIYEISASRPAGIVVNGWRPVLEYEQPFYSGFIAMSLLFLFLPQTVAAFTYLSLYFRAEAVQRSRILLVATGILMLSLGAIVISRPPLGGASWLQAAGRAAVILAAFAILRAYLPQREPASARAGMEAAFRQRVLDLI